MKTAIQFGAGNIGRIVADRAKGMKMKVIVYDPYIKPEALERLDLEPVSFDELLERSDYITIHTPKTDETINTNVKIDIIEILTFFISFPPFF